MTDMVMLDIVLTPPGRLSPTSRQQLKQFGAMLGEALNDPEVLEKVRLAADAYLKLEESAANDEGTLEEEERLADVVIDSCRAASDLVERRHPEFSSLLGEHGIQPLLFRLFSADEGGFPIRLAGVPGFEGRPIMTLFDANDVRAMRRELRPGQVWVNASKLDHDKYFKLWSLVSLQRQALGEVLKPPGRRAGSMSLARLELANEIKAAPSLTYADIYDRGVKLGVWPDDGSYYEHPERNRKRILRLKELAK